MATPYTGDRVLGTNAVISEGFAKQLTDLPAELLEYILCFPALNHFDICNVSCTCKRLRDVCHGRGKVWAHQYKLRWHLWKKQTFLKNYNQHSLPDKPCAWLKLDPSMLDDLDVPSVFGLRTVRARVHCDDASDMSCVHTCREMCMCRAWNGLVTSRISKATYAHIIINNYEWPWTYKCSDYLLSLMPPCKYLQNFILAKFVCIKYKALRILDLFNFLVLLWPGYFSIFWYLVYVIYNKTRVTIDWCH